MNRSTFGWFYSNLSNRAPAWSGVEELYTFGIRNSSEKGIRFKIVDINELKMGDIIQFRHNSSRFTHTLIINNISHPSPSGIFIACHSNDAYNKKLSDFSFQEIRFLKVLN